ncbi:MAG: DUF4286 family protein [Phycisphaerales bacterium]
MQRIAYTVRATFPSRALADEYVAWLDDGHIDQVIAGGAHSATVIRLDGAAPSSERIEVRYVFSTREIFDRYLEQHAPALRADGLKRFGPEKGIAFERTIGVIL